MSATPDTNTAQDTDAAQGTNTAQDTGATPAPSTARDPAAPRGVIVTGGGTGIGRAVARAFADRGDRVLVVGRTPATLARTAEGRPGIDVLTADLTDPDTPRAVTDAALNAFGRIDVLVNNAASGGFAALAETKREAARDQLDTNLLAPLLLTRQTLDALAADGGGTVLNIGSAGALYRRAWPENGIYGAAKAGLDFLTRTWAVELAARGIRVLGLAPGVIDTGIGERSGMTPEAYAGFLQHIATVVPAGRVGRPEDVAWWAVQLTDPRAAYATGAVLAVDGGLSLT
ncbi:SDR family oxidoreductase [Streptomyces sp. BH-SS-21]|uniref:SDR family oxidoreductase n=1 Tax=Streptomyces liliiviolaceus TaxID=2823109 RepID=A0A940XN31_9ACTN|nr:SDR family oxidoreductase [Streptomyces liliiviolaceus]MBQ0848989.1 SDR family oxidoreductase [Streptomyces liliiviolaceus]